MKEVQTTAALVGGVLSLRNRKTFDRQLRLLKDGEYLVSVYPAERSRSMNQNAYYWGVVIEALSEHTGYRPEELHELMKARFLPRGKTGTFGNGILDGAYVFGGSTTKLTKSEMSEYTERIRQWAAQDLDFVIPDPEHRP